jgi:hypothetical protein
MHSSILGTFISFEENEVLWIRPHFHIIKRAKIMQVVIGTLPLIPFEIL